MGVTELEDKFKRKRGRPRKEGNERCIKRFSFHETEEQTYMRKALEEETGKNGGEVIREALEILYNMKIGWKQ